MPKIIGPSRFARKTILVVGEGYAEQCFLKHIRSLYTGDRRGHKLTLGNARGKGAAHVIDYAVRLKKQADYDTTAALFDTDTAWTAAARKQAQQHKVVLLTSEPCLEAWLLDTAGYGRDGTTQDHKERFRARFNGNADDAVLIEKHFTRATLDAARLRIEVLDKLLNLLGV